MKFQPPKATPASKEQIYRIGACPDIARDTISICFDVPASSPEIAIERAQSFAIDAENEDADNIQNENYSYQSATSMKFYVNSADGLHFYVQNEPDDCGESKLADLRRVFYKDGAISADEMIHQALADKVLEVADSDDPNSLTPEKGGMEAWFASQPAKIVRDYCDIPLAEIKGATDDESSRNLPLEHESVSEWISRCEPSLPSAITSEKLFDTVRGKLYEAAGYSSEGLPIETDSPDIDL